MSFAAFSDWSGSVPMTYEEMPSDWPDFLLSMARFLFGENKYLFRVKNRLPSDIQRKVSGKWGTLSEQKTSIPLPWKSMVWRCSVVGVVTQIADKRWRCGPQKSDTRHFCDILRARIAGNRFNVPEVVSTEVKCIREETISRSNDPDEVYGT